MDALVWVFTLLRFSAPVGIAALGETVAQKAGVLNIGIEGQMLSGAFFATLAAHATGSPWLGLAAGIASALALGLIQGFLTINLGADQVVTGTALNLFSLGLTGSLFRAQFGASGQLLSLPGLPEFGPGLDPVLILFLLAVPAVAWALKRTRWGLAIRGSGEYPEAVEASGHSPSSLRWGASLLGAALAGLAGAYLVLGVAGSFAENMSAGRGFVAIAMVTFGRWKPWGVLAASLLIGYAESLQFTLQASNTGIPYQALIALPYVLALAILIVAGKGASGPAALGMPFRRSA